MKKIKDMKPGAKKQLLSGMVYIALAVTVVAVTIGTVVTTFSEPEQNISENKNGVTDYENNFTLKLPENSVEVKDFTLDTPVSDAPSGINAEVTVPDTIAESDLVISENTVEEFSEEPVFVTDSPDKSKPVSEEPEEVFSDYGYDGFIKPCSGYVSKEFSIDLPVYSVSMYDYRIHKGIDIVNEIGTPVKAVSNGVIADIYDDYLYGTTVVIEHKDGIKSVYSNLSADLPVETVIGRTVITGEIIGGIGETAVCEAAEAHHLHLEMIKDGEYVNPEEYF